MSQGLQRRWRAGELRRSPAPPDDTAEEAELIARAIRDPGAFAALYRRHHPAIARYLHRRVGSAHAVEDLVSETFVLALESLPRYRPRGLPLRSWLFRLATTSVSRWVRREHRRGMQPLGAEPPAPAEASDADAERLGMARTALLALPSRFQDVLSLHYLEELPVGEVARILGCREGTVKSRLSRGRDQLRRQLEKGNQRS